MTLAQISEQAGPWAAAGVPGVCLMWFMVRAERRFQAIENSMDRSARSMLLLVISLDSSNGTVRRKADELISELDQKSRRAEMVS